MRPPPQLPLVEAPSSVLAQRALQRLLALNQLASRTRDVDELMALATDVLHDVLEPSRSSVLLVGADKVMHFRAWRGLSEHYRRAVDGHSPWRMDDPAPQPVLIHDVTAAPALKSYGDLFQREGIGALAFIPLISGGQLVGKFMLYYDEPHAFTPDEVALAEAIAGHIAFVVSRHQAEADLSLYRQIFEASTEPTAIIDGAGRYVAQNAAHASLVGYADAELEGKTPSIHLGEDGFARVRDALLSNRRCEIEVASRTKSGRRLEVELRAFTIHDDQGRPRLFVGTKRDVTDTRRAERRLRLLAQAGEILGEQGEPTPMLERVARAVAGSFADWCLVDLIAADGRPERVCAVSGDPKLESLLEELRTSYPFTANSPATEAIQRGEPVLIREMQEDAIRQRTVDERHFTLIRALAPTSIIAVPLLGRDCVLGAMTFCWGQSGRTYDEGDLECARDLGRRVATALEGARLTRELNEAVRARDEFLSIASHELKTPLTSLQLQLEKASRSGDARAQPSIEAASRQVRRLSRLVDELLEVSRMSAGRLKLEPERFDLAELLSDVARRFEPELVRSGSQLSVEAPPPLIGNWDRLRIDIAVTNLLSNACKYGAGNPIRVSARTDGDSAVIEVRDEGIGIAAEHMSRLFGRFERMVSARHFGGFGLGLWISRNIVEAHGGMVQVESTPGLGSTFRIRLPR